MFSAAVGAAPGKVATALAVPVPSAAIHCDAPIPTRRAAVQRLDRRYYSASYKLSVVREVRQIGLMVGIELKVEAQPYLARLLDRGIFALPAGPTVVRLLPPLVLTDEQIDTVADRLVEVLTTR